MFDLRLDLESTRHIINKVREKWGGKNHPTAQEADRNPGHVEYTLSVDIGCTVVSPNIVHQTVDTATSSGSKMRLEGQGFTSIGKRGW